jgi:hypothetical protein
MESGLSDKTMKVADFIETAKQMNNISLSDI